MSLINKVLIILVSALFFYMILGRFKAYRRLVVKYNILSLFKNLLLHVFLYFFLVIVFVTIETKIRGDINVTTYSDLVVSGFISASLVKVMEIFQYERYKKDLENKERRRKKK